MEVPPPASGPAGSGYIRGGGGVGVDGGRLLRILALLVVAGLIALSAGLAVSASTNNSRADALRTRGVAVPVTVTGCLGISSGVGMGIEYWQCRGTYTLGGHSYQEVIGGSRSFLETGRVVPAVAVPGRPDLLSLKVPARRGSGLGAYTASMVVGALAAVLAAGLAWDLRRTRRRAAP